MREPAASGAERPQLVCLHAAGATSAMFADLAGHLRGRVAVETIDLPGRGSSYHRAPLRRCNEAVAYLMPLLRDLPDRGYVVLGYSMGALIAFELARALHREDGPLPAALIVAAARAPQVPAREAALHALDDEALLQELIRFEGTTQELLGEPELMALVLPRLRADFELCETYAFRRAPRLPLPVHAFGGLADPRVSADDLAAWRDLAAAGSTCEQLPGGHFFIQQEGEAMAERVAAVAQRIGTAWMACGIAGHG